MNNKPVAWMLTDRVVSSIPIEGAIPLYTHPAKKLTDEEILELTNDSTIFEYREFNDDMVRFARAILRKANEK